VPQQRHGLCEAYTVIQLGETNHIATATTAVAVEQVLAGIYQQTGPLIGV
jgi:hypothetical protein